MLLGSKIIARELIPSIDGVPQIVRDLRLPGQDEQAGCHLGQSHFHESRTGTCTVELGN